MRSSRWISRCSDGWRPRGRASRNAGTEPTRCSTPSSSCRARALPASILETEILPARIDGYDPADLDAVASAGEVVWIGVESLGARDGRVALYLADHLSRLLPPDVRLAAYAARIRRTDARSVRLRQAATSADARGRSARDGHPQTSSGARRVVFRSGARRHRRRLPQRNRCSAVESRLERADHQRHLPCAACVHARSRAETTAAEERADGVPVAPPRTAIGRGTLDARRRARRRRQEPRDSLGLGLGAAAARAARCGHPRGGDGGGVARRLRCGLSGAEGHGRKRAHSPRLFRRRPRRDAVRAARRARSAAFAARRRLNRSARDPKWRSWPRPTPPTRTAPRIKFPAFAAPSKRGAARRGKPAPTRTVGATVILVDGALAAWLARGDRLLLTFLPEAEPDRSKRARAVAQVLIDRARAGGDSPRGMLVEEIDGLPPAAHPIAPYLVEAGFIGGALGYQATFHARR